MVGRVTVSVPAPALIAALCILACLAQPDAVNIIGNNVAGGLTCDGPGLPEYCEYRFVAQLDPVPPGCTVEFDWTFEGCGAQVVEGGDTASPLVRFNQTGVCNISLEAHVVEAPGCSPQQWVGTARFFVIGGPFRVTLANAVPNYSKDYHADHTPWYLTYHGFDPASGQWPEECFQMPVGAVISAVYDQPQGEGYRTVYDWWYAPSQLWMENASQNGTENAREARFYARVGSAPGGVAVYLGYALILGDVTRGIALDTSDCVNYPGQNYRTFTAHMPKGTDLASANPSLDLTTLVGDPFPAPPPYYNERFYTYRLVDHLGFWMPGSWVQERFPNDVPQGFEANLRGAPWITRSVRPWDGAIVGKMDLPRPDWIRAPIPEWWSISQHPGDPYVLAPYPFGAIRHQYWAGSSDTLVNAPGCLVGVRDIMFWSDQIQHLPSRWPAWDWPSPPPPPPPPPPWPR